MPFWKKKKSKQQKSTAKEKPAVGPVKPKQRPSSLPPKYEPPKMPDYILKKEDALKTAINQVYGSKSEKAVTPSTVQQKNSDTRKEFSKSVRTAYYSSQSMGCVERLCRNVCLFFI